MEPNRPPTAAEIEAEIRRLEEQRARAVAPEEQRYRALVRESLSLEIARLERQKAHSEVLEDQRRGALMRKYLRGRSGKAIRAVLQRVVGVRDAHLFGLAEGLGADSRDD
jgi:hypothetical protein